MLRLNIKLMCLALVVGANALVVGANTDLTTSKKASQEANLYRQFAQACKDGNVLEIIRLMKLDDSIMNADGRPTKHLVNPNTCVDGKPVWFNVFADKDNSEALKYLLSFKDPQGNQRVQVNGTHVKGVYDAKRHTALIEAILGCKFDTVMTLLEHGAMTCVQKPGSATGCADHLLDDVLYANRDTLTKDQKDKGIEAAKKLRAVWMRELGVKYIE